MNNNCYHEFIAIILYLPSFPAMLAVRMGLHVKIYGCNKDYVFRSSCNTTDSLYYRCDHHIVFEILWNDGHCQSF